MVCKYQELSIYRRKIKKLFVCPIKSNRKIALTLEDKNNGNYVNISSTDREW